MPTIERFFSQGFRPFFLSAGLWAVVSMALWVLIFSEKIETYSLHAAGTWHIHEMLFGYVAAVIAGFLLTAVPNWTGVPAPSGVRLGLLWGLWLFGRIAYFFSGVLPLILVAIPDILFLCMFEVYLIRALTISGNKRNFVVAALIGGLIVSNILSYTVSLGEVGNRLGLFFVIVLISLIGGRIIPNFTRNYLRSNGAGKIPAEFGLPDKLALLSSVLALMCFVIGLEHGVAGLLFLVAFVLGLWRLVRWYGMAAADEPLVWVMHLAYLWLPIGYLLMGLHYLGLGIGLNSALHALTTGAIGTMTLAIMTRASLGHSGRALRAGPWTLIIYICITLAAVLRVAAGIAIDPQFAYSASGVVWVLAFGLFCLTYGPVFFRERTD